MSTQTNREIERKFLVVHMPKDVNSCKKADITQYCIASRNGIGGNAIRIRKKASSTGTRYFITVKRRSDGDHLLRYENDVRIHANEYNALRRSAIGRKISKTRYYLPKRVELDVYNGRLRGLVIAEVEFKSQRAAKLYVQEKWMGKEVTGVKRYSNWSLAVNGLAKKYIPLLRGQK